MFREIRSYDRTQDTIYLQGHKRTYDKGQHDNIAYPNQHINIEMPHGSIDHVLVPDTVKITFNLEF